MKKTGLRALSITFLSIALLFVSCGNKISSAEDLVNAISKAKSMEEIEKCITSISFDKRIEYQKEIGKVIINDQQGNNEYTTKACLAYCHIVFKNADDNVYGDLSDSQKNMVLNIDKTDIPIRTAAAKILGSDRIVQIVQEAYSYYGLQLLR